MNTLEDKINELLIERCEDLTDVQHIKLRDDLLQAFRESVERSDPGKYENLKVGSYEHGYNHGVEHLTANLLKELGAEQLSKGDK